MKNLSAVLCVALLVTITPVAQSQVVNALGIPPFSSIGGGSFDQINLGNLNTHLELPIINKPGRGLPFTFALTYDSLVWAPVTSGSTTTWQMLSNGGWHATGTYTTATFNWSGPYTRNCTWNTQQWTYSYFRVNSFTDPMGVKHYGGREISNDTDVVCNPDKSSATIPANDGSGMTGNVSTDGASVFGSVSLLNGTVVGGANGSWQDTNGNYITGSIDTLGSNVLTISGTAPNDVTYTYTGPSGNVSFTLKYYSPQTIATAFSSACPSIQDVTISNIYLVKELDLPDYNSTTNPAAKYTFSYEPNPNNSSYTTGRLASVTLPTGGQISYSYGSGSSIECADGTPVTLTRTTPDGSTTFSRSNSSGSWQTTITDAMSEVSTYTFTTNTTTNPSLTNFYETKRVVQDASSNALATVWTCYNGSCPTGSTVALPFSSIAVYSQYGSGGIARETNTTYNSNGEPTRVDEYDLGSANSNSPPSVGGLIRSQVTTYSGAFPIEVDVDAPGGGFVAKTLFSYDEYAVQPTSGTPQHVSGFNSGNLTTVQKWTSGTSYLTTHYHYYDTGNIYTATDVNGAQTTYTFGMCGNSFPSSIAEPLSLSRSMNWDCTGGVMTSSTDENGKTTSLTYNDPYYWRLNAATDPLLNTTNITYAPNTTESALVFNSNRSTSDILQTVDSLGRSHLSQVRQSPGSTNFDSTESDYDALGRPNRTTLPYVGTAGQINATAPAVSMTYDPLNRPLQVSDAGGGYTSYSYDQNTTTITIGPAPTGENTKQRKLVSDGLGRLVQVNEPSPLGATYPATSGSGYVDIGGSLQSTQVQTSQGSQSTATVTISGTEQRASVPDCPLHQTCYIYDQGDLYITVNGVTVTASYTQGSNYSSVASALVTSVNNNGSMPVAATSSGGVITLTSKSIGAGTNYSLSAGVMDYDSSDFTHASFSAAASGGNMSGGSDPAYTTVYDAGSVQITVNGEQHSVSYSQGSTASGIASALASAFSGSPNVSASASGTRVSFTSIATGASTNYSLSASSSTSQGGYFSQPSFTTAPSGGSLTGGADQYTSGGLNNPYVTQYSYDLLDDLSGVTQNQQAGSSNWQTRSFLYDGARRMTQETNPESGTTYYTYDIDPTCGTYTGDLVKKIDAVGNVTCFAYDALHRLIAKTYPSGSYASSTPEKHYVYDSATVNGVSMPNSLGRMAEAFTGPSSAKITDEGFAYSARGEVTDVYESTPHSGGYYHVSASYFANGTMNQLNMPGVPSLYYGKSDGTGLDGEGRPTYVSAASGQNPITAVSYNGAGLPTAATFGSSDSDGFIFDSNTLRMNQYSFNIGSSTVAGALTWNANGSLQKLAITDPLNPANQQTCNYASDDLARIASVDCGATKWQQNFSYDVFGNITKAVPERRYRNSLAGQLQSKYEPHLFRGRLHSKLRCERKSYQRQCSWIFLGFRWSRSEH